MSQENSFSEFVIDQLRDLPEVRPRRMFDSTGLYCGDKFFAIIWNERLFFKTHEHTRQRYLDEGMKPFAPSKKQVLKNYYEVPPDIIEDRDRLTEWAGEAVNL